MIILTIRKLKNMLWRDVIAEWKELKAFYKVVVLRGDEKPHKSNAVEFIYFYFYSVKDEGAILSLRTHKKCFPLTSPKRSTCSVLSKISLNPRDQPLCLLWKRKHIDQDSTQVWYEKIKGEALRGGNHEPHFWKKQKTKQSACLLFALPPMGVTGICLSRNPWSFSLHSYHFGSSKSTPKQAKPLGFFLHVP